MNFSSSKRIVWFDMVRLIAMFTVICCHCTDPFNFYPGKAPEEIKFWGAAYGSLLRPCVPLFVMLTGALLLPIRETASVFYKKRILRILYPFLIWSVVYNLFPWLSGLVGMAPETILDFFPYSGEAGTQQSLEVSMSYITQMPFNFSLLDVHMWYIYLLIGLYLYMPIFSAWVEKASDKAKLTFLLLWGITLFIPYYREFADKYLWGTCSWNEFGMLYYFAGFNGYLLLGHYLSKTEWNMTQTAGIGIPMFVTGYVITFTGFRHISSLPDYTPEQLELFFYYCSPNVVLMTIPIFMLCKKITITGQRTIKALANLTACGFGIYMIHYFFTGPSVLLARNLHIPLGVQIPFAALITFAVSWTLVYLLRRICGKYARIITG